MNHGIEDFGHCSSLDKQHIVPQVRALQLKGLNLQPETSFCFFLPQEYTHNNIKADVQQLPNWALSDNLLNPDWVFAV